MKKTLKNLTCILLTLTIFLFCSQTSILPVSADSILNKINKFLLIELEKISDEDTLDVSVWIKDIDYSLVKKNTDDLLSSKKLMGNDSFSNNEARNLYEDTAKKFQRYVNINRDISQTMYIQHNSDYIQKLTKLSDDKHLESNIKFVSKYAPNFTVNLKKKDIQRLASSPYVEEIFLDVDKNFYSAKNENSVFASLQATKMSDHMQDVFDSSYIYDLHDRGLQGSGVKIGMLEECVPNKNLSCFQHLKSDNRLRIRAIDNHISGTNDNNHANMVASLLVGKDTSSGFLGVAPNASLYCVSYRSRGFKNGIEWLISSAQGVNVINISCWLFGMDEIKDNNNQYGDIAKWLDHVANNHNVLIIQAAGNGGGITSGAMAYNSIAVGNFDLLNNSIFHASSYCYGGTLPSKPDIVAPGTWITTPANPSSSETGTSFAAPLVAGTAALICQFQPSLKTNPSLLKSILLTGATKNKAWDLERYKYGSGLLNAINPYYILDKGYFSSSTFNTSWSYISKTITAAANGRKLSVGLSWIKNNTITSSDHDYGNVTSSPIGKFKLEVISPGGQIWKSENLYDNKQLVELYPPVSGKYTIKISKIGTFSDNIKYGLSYYQS